MLSNGLSPDQDQEPHKVTWNGKIFRHIQGFRRAFHYHSLYVEEANTADQPKVAFHVHEHPADAWGTSQVKEPNFGIHEDVTSCSMPSQTGTAVCGVYMGPTTVQQTQNPLNLNKCIQRSTRKSWQRRSCCGRPGCRRHRPGWSCRPGCRTRP